MTTISESLGLAGDELLRSGVDEPFREASSLLQFVLGRDRTFLIAHPEYELVGNEEKRFNEAVRRRSAREPFHHITGTKEFYGLEFLVSADVLIPRPETEMLVEAATDRLANAGKYFCEIGVGSGCIAVSILKNVPASSAIGLEISPAAIAVAEKNAALHSVEDRLEIRRSDLFASLGDERFDLIVTNPPYIPAADLAGLQPEVELFEPNAALTDGGNGLSLISAIIDNSPRFLHPGGTLLIEIGFGQADAVGQMLDSSRFRRWEIVPDLQQIPRMVKAVFSE